VKEKPCWRDESSLVDAASIKRYRDGLRS
jgi:hypothetical protein